VLRSTGSLKFRKWEIDGANGKFISATNKTVRIESKFMDCCIIDTAVKPFRGKVASCIRMALQCDQDLREATLEQFSIDQALRQEMRLLSSRNIKRYDMSSA